MTEHRTKGGHESGSMTIGETLKNGIPEALFKPGAGAPQPTPPVSKGFVALDSLGDTIDLIRRRWAEADHGGREFLAEALETCAAIVVRNLRAEITDA